MRKYFMLLSLVVASAASAQDLLNQEVVVTAQRVEQDDYSDFMPAVGLRRQADFLVQEVTIRGDTRDPRERAKEMRSMLRKAVEMASKSGVELATGVYIVTKLTVDGIEDLELKND